MQRSIKDYFTITLKGMAMGAADVVPGVSGGTIAFITGIYQELIETISGVNLSLITVWKNEGFKAMWQKLNGPFILALFAGILISIFSLMRLVNFLLEEHPVHVWAFFFGLILASVWFVAKQIPKWNLKIIVGLVLGAAAAFYIVSLPPMVGSSGDWFLFLAGAIAICAMILPGISGAFILVLLGAYRPVLQAVNNFDIKTILIFGIGAVVGLLSFARVLKWLFRHYTNITLAVLTGFIAGSLNKIWPWKAVLSTYINSHNEEVPVLEKSILPGNYDGDPQILSAVVACIVGFLLIFLLEKLAVRKKGKI